MAPGSSDLNVLVSLDFDKKAYKAAEKQKLTFSLKNESGNIIRLLKWDTPLEGFKSNMFHVEYDGKRAVYLGRIYRRGDPTEVDYVTLQPAETIAAEVDLSDEYDIAEAGNYQVRYRAEFLHGGVEEPKVLKKAYMASTEPPVLGVKAAAASFKLEQGRLPKQENGIQVGWMKRMKTFAAIPLSFNGFSASQENTIREALAQAVQMSAEASAVLSTTPDEERSSARRYREWFGSFDGDRYDKVDSNFANIWDALANKDLTFTACEENYYAWVSPSLPYEIHLCRKFWSAPLTGNSSKADTLIHEMSHFFVVAGTDDLEYGMGSCKTLARNNPSKAVQNADNYAFYGVNSPPL